MDDGGISGGWMVMVACPKDGTELGGYLPLNCRITLKNILVFSINHCGT